MRRSDSTPPHLAASLDEEFIDAFNAAYSGSLNPADALWWLQHPDDSGPSGAAAPSVAMEEARRALYGGGLTAESLALHTQTLLDYWREVALTTRAGFDARTASRPRRFTGRLLILAGLVACGMGAVLGIGLTSRAADTGRPSSAATLKYPATAFPPGAQLTTVPEIATVGAAVLRMSDDSPRIGGEWAQSGTTAFQSSVLPATGSLMLSVRCSGGARLVVIIGQEGLNDGGFATVDCPDTSVTTVTTVLPPNVTSRPFRVVAVEQQPVIWRVVLSRFHST